MGSTFHSSSESSGTSKRAFFMTPLPLSPGLCLLGRLGVSMSSDVDSSPSIVNALSPECCRWRCNMLSKTTFPSSLDRYPASNAAFEVKRNGHRWPRPLLVPLDRAFSSLLTHFGSHDPEKLVDEL